MRIFTQEDNMVVMARYPDKYFDLCIVDPPYGLERATPHAGKGWKKHLKKDWDNEIPSEDYFKELFRVSNDQIIWGANYFTKYLPASKAWIFWDKGQDLTMSDGELAYSSFEKVTRRVVMNRCKIGEYGGIIHSTQKPVDLYRWLLTNYAKSGDLILDTHVGSASSLIAFEELGFDYVACELDPDYYAAAIKRLEQYRSQPKIEFEKPIVPQPIQLNIA